ncbi:hypothetical protein OA165_03030 [Prochlorococcus sp. AH-736-A21]|nr:hypothetical protein [Prochlorococcus sp. AH-736-A21]
MKKIFSLSLIFTLSSFIPVIAENKLSNLSAQIIKLNPRKLFKGDLVERDGVFYLKDSHIPYSGKVIYEKNRFLYETGTLENGKKIGEWITRYNDSGVLERKNTYVNGKIKDGLRKNYHWNGRLWNSVNFTNGKMHGIWEEYGDDGNLGQRVRMIDGKAEGFWDVFHDNGQIYYSHNYINGIREDGIFSAFFDNGQLRRQGNIKDGERDGIWEYFNIDGSLKAGITFANGKVISRFTPPKNTALCTLASEKESDVKISMHYPSTGYGYGTLNYKDEPEYYFEVGISNGYGTQYYQLKTYSAEASHQYTGLPYLVRTKDTELISNGRFVNFVDNNLARSTTKQERRKGTMKALMPTLPSDYYYSLTNNHKEGEYGRFNLSPKMKAILNASEGFFVDSGGCRKYFKYGWD